MFISFRGVFVCILTIFVLSKHASADNILVTVHPGSSQWWYALAVSDRSIVKVETKDSSSSADWAALTSSNWGYWVFTTTGNAAVYPISVRVTSVSGSLVFDNLINSKDDSGKTFNTHAGFPSGAPTVAPGIPDAVKGDITISQSLVNSWSGGAQYSVKIKNNGATALTAIGFTSSTQNFVNVWGISQADHVFGFPSYVNSIDAGSLHEWGYVINGDSPATFTITSTTFGSSDSATGSPTSSATSPPATSAPTSAPTTVKPSSVPDTKAPTSAPATQAPATSAPATSAPATSAPATNPPATQAPATSAPATSAPATSAPATSAPATSAPATSAPTTKAPATSAPTTKAPATSAPATSAPATSAPVTSAPATPAPATQAPNGGGSITLTGNPYLGASFFSPPYYAAQVQSAVNANPSMQTLSSLVSVPVVFWIDNIAKIASLGGVLASAKGQQASSGSPVVVTIVIYDLPSRDCAALASNGEIPCADAACADGINKYKTEYIDPIVAILKNYQDIRISAIVEPDSLPNLVTNLGVPKCTTAQTAYKTCVAYAIEKLSTQPNLAIYVDAAHGGWIGWSANLAGLSQIFAEVFTNAGGHGKVRGFSTNVANYQPLGSLTSTEDPCGLAAQYNFAINEVSYTKLLSDALTAAGVPGKTFIIDTSRNGVPGARTSCSNWCNINKAGLGVRPVANPSNLGVTNIDALLWVKPPGESDGTSDTSAARYDAHCNSADSVAPAPEAGQWFPSYFTMLAQNANPPL